MNWIVFLEERILDIILVVVVTLGIITVGNTIFKILEKRFEKFLKKRKINLDIIFHLKKFIFIALLILGLQISLWYTKLIPEIYAQSFSNLFSIIWVILVSYALIRIIKGALDESKGRIRKGIVYLMKKLISIFIVFVAFTLILRILNIEITPLLASLGIAGLAIAFALKDTLENFFAGMYLTADRPIRPGDYIELDSEIRGKVLDIGWRSTKLVNTENNKIIIPNRMMGNKIITNFNLPKGAVRTEVDVDVAYGSDVDKVEKVLLKTAKKIKKKMDECDDNYEPVVRFTKFGSSGLGFKVFLRAKSREASFLVGKELKKAIYKEFKKNKIEIPFTTHTVYLKK